MLAPMLGAKSSIHAVTDSFAVDPRFPGESAARFMASVFLRYATQNLQRVYVSVTLARPLPGYAPHPELALQEAYRTEEERHAAARKPSTSVRARQSRHQAAALGAPARGRARESRGSAPVARGLAALL